MNIHTILIGIALLLAVIAIIKPGWPLLAVSVILVCVDLLVGRGGP